MVTTSNLLRALVLLWGLGFISLSVNAQRSNRSFSQRDYSEGYVFLKGGPAYCFGDAFGSPFAKNLLMGENYSTSLGFRNKLSDYLAVSFQADFARYTNSDSELRSHSIGFYSSESKVYKGIFRTELHLPINKRFRYNDRNNIYFFAGLGGAYGILHYPEGAYVGVPEVSSAIIPVGFGYTYAFSEIVSLGIEFSCEITHSDYFDGYISTNNGRSYNDLFVSSLICLSFKIF